MTTLPQSPSQRKSLPRITNKKFVSKLNETVNQIADKAFSLQQNHGGNSRCSKLLLCSARNTPQVQHYNAKQNIIQKNYRQQKFDTRQKNQKKVRVFQNTKSQLQNNEIYGKTVGSDFYNKISSSQNQLFLTTMQDEFNFTQGFKQFPNSSFKLSKPTLRVDLKWTFQQFIRNLYIQKTKDLKTRPNLKQQKIFVQKFRTKLQSYDPNQKKTVDTDGKPSIQWIEQINVPGSDFGVNSIRCICEYILSKQLTRISIAEIHNFCNIKTIILDKNPLGDEAIGILASAMNYFGHLQKLSLVSVNMSPKGAKLMLRSLMGLQNLIYVDFSSAEGLNRNRFGDSIDQLQLIFNQPSFSWQYVQLSNVNLGDQGLSLISKGVNKCNPIKQIFLSQNDIKSTQIPLFLSKFKVTHLISLDLSNNQIGDEGFKQIGQLIGSQYGYNSLSKSLKILNVSNNQIKSYGLMYFCKNMLKNQSLTELNLSSNILSKGQKFPHFKYFIIRNWTLKKIDMSNCFTNSDDLRQLFEGLQENRALQQLKISKNNFSVETFGALAKMLIINKSLRCLQAESCDIGDKYVQKFQKQLKQIRCIEQVNFNNNFLSDKCGKILIQMISDSKSITKALFLKNCLGIKVQNEITQMLKSNKTIKQHSKLDQKQFQYMKYVSEIQNNQELVIRCTIDKLQKQQQKVKYTSLICQLVKAQIQEQQHKKQLEQQINKIRQLEQKLKKK